MKIIIISILTLFLFSCLDGQDGLFGTNGKIGCVENSDCEKGYTCEKGKCEKGADKSCTKNEDCYELQRCNKSRNICEWSFGTQCSSVSDCGNTLNGKTYQCEDIGEVNGINLCFFENCNGVSDAIDYSPDFMACLPRCTDDYLCTQIFGAGRRVCKVSEGRCVESNNSSFVCNPVTNEGCTGSELCYLYFAGTTARAVCDATLERSVAENSSCDYSTDSICDTGLGCSSVNKCKKLCSGNCDTPRCTGYGNHSGTEIGLCDY